MGVRVETRGSDHELHDCWSATAGRIELESRLRSTWSTLGARLVGRIDVGHVSVDVASVDETTDENDAPIRKGLCS